MFFLVPYLVILAYVIIGFPENPESAPRGLFIAIDHATFVGLLTNAVFGMLLVAGASRRSVGAKVDQVIFWGTNIGLIGFLTGLIFDVVILKRISTPIMGLSILLGLAVAAMRLGKEPAPATADG